MYVVVIVVKLPERWVDDVVCTLEELEWRVDDVPLVVTVNTRVEVLVMMVLLLDEPGEARELELLCEDVVGRLPELLCEVDVGNLLELDEDAWLMILKSMVMVYKTPVLDSTSNMTGTVRPTKASGGSI